MIKKPLLWREITVPNSPSLSDIEPLYQAIQRLVACKGRNLEERARTDEKLQQALTARKRLLNEDVGSPRVFAEIRDAATWVELCPHKLAQLDDAISQQTQEGRSAAAFFATHLAGVFAKLRHELVGKVRERLSAFIPEEVLDDAANACAGCLPLDLRRLALEVTILDQPESLPGYWARLQELNAEVASFGGK